MSPPRVNISEILLATDFSDSSRTAVRVAGALARRLDARLHVLHVAPPSEAMTAFAEVHRVADAIRQAGDVSLVKALETGAPAQKIVGYAAKNGIDLIVMGTHGRTGLSHVVHGSIAEAVVRTAPCQVLTVRHRPEEAPSRSPGAESTAPRRCLLCADPGAGPICERCSARVTAEARERKVRELRAHP